MSSSTRSPVTSSTKALTARPGRLAGVSVPLSSALLDMGSLLMHFSLRVDVVTSPQEDCKATDQKNGVLDDVAGLSANSA